MKKPLPRPPMVGTRGKKGVKMTVVFRVREKGEKFFFERQKTFKLRCYFLSQ